MRSAAEEKNMASERSLRSSDNSAKRTFRILQRRVKRAVD